MHDRAILAATLKRAFEEIASQADKLGTALLNVSPGEKVEGAKQNAPTKSVEYLLASAKANRECAERCKAFIPDDPLSS